MKSLQSADTVPGSRAVNSLQMCLSVFRSRTDRFYCLLSQSAIPLSNVLKKVQNQAKSRKYQGVFEVKSRVKTWQVRGIWSQQLEH